VHALVASDAARGDRCVLALIARIGGTPAGFVVATMDTRSYWRAALRRRPAALLAVIAARLAQRRHRTRPSGDTPRSHTASVPAVSPPLAPAATAPLQWSVDAPDLAKIGFIGVLPEFRRQGVGEALYRALFDAAASRGGRAVLARIAADNVASLWLHHAAGWDLFRDDAGPFAVLTLPTTSSSS
jgi:ribosomal protein S18 acetylase RimI-like enzyme